jgi:hypothetical protein
MSIKNFIIFIRDFKLFKIINKTKLFAYDY